MKESRTTTEAACGCGSCRARRELLAKAEVYASAGGAGFHLMRFGALLREAARRYRCGVEPHLPLPE
jgi:hypothetical protein